MLQMGEYSARQQLKLSAMEAEVRENQAVTAQVNQLQAEKRQLQDMSKRLTFSLTNAEQEKGVGLGVRASCKGLGARAGARARVALTQTPHLALTRPTCPRPTLRACSRSNSSSA